MSVDNQSCQLISNSRRIKRSCAIARDYAQTGRPVLITGEAGTGRRHLARAIHATLKTGTPLAETDAADLSPTRLIELSAESVLFVRNLPFLPVETQKELAARLHGRDERVLPHLVFSALPDLPTRISSGMFLSELYYVLAACEIHLPALRERVEDIPVLVEHFVRMAADELQQPRVRVDVSFIDRLVAYPFPGNVCELKTLVYKAIQWATEDRLTEEVAAETLDNHSITAIADQLVRGRTHALSQILFPAHLPSIAETKRQLIMEALRRTGGNQSKAARILGLTPPAINKFLTRMENPEL